jgi:hypothetical protein
MGDQGEIETIITVLSESLDIVQSGIVVQFCADSLLSPNFLSLFDGDSIG